jgi:NitT/TauT family transport system substrate-binding protein
MRRTLCLLAGFAVLVLAAGPGRAADKVVLGTDWRAQAEQGGFYQALAKGYYEDAGLDVTIRQGGPQVNQAQLLAAGRLDVALTNSFIALNYLQQSIPMVAVAATFQKDPAVLIAHPNQGISSFEDLRGKPIYIGPDSRVGFWLFLKAKFGYTDSQIRPYTFSIAPFLTDKKVVQQGYLGSEPYLMEQHGIDPVILLLADAGFRNYAALVQTSRRLTETKPDVVRRFVAASMRGWADYLKGDPAPANALIKRDNPEMTDGLLAYGRKKMNEYGIVLSGDARKDGIGAMTEARWAGFFKTMSGEGLYKPDLDWRKAYTTEFLPGPNAAK